MLRSASVVAVVVSVSVIFEFGPIGVVVVNAARFASGVPLTTPLATNTVTWKALLPPAAIVPRLQVSLPVGPSLQPPVSLT